MECGVWATYLSSYVFRSLQFCLTERRFQLSTNDGWAASVVRPVLDLDVFGGLLLLLYTWVTHSGLDYRRLCTYFQVVYVYVYVYVYV